MQPLQGPTVVTLEHAIAAPFATRQLADLGACVLKIERPGVGDFARGYDERVRGMASHFVWTNRSKESLTLDVKHPQARAILQRLVLEKADVVVQNPRARRGGAARRQPRGLVGAEAVADRLRHLRLWRRSRAPRPVPRQEGLRPVDPERGRLRQRHRHSRHTVESRPVDRRHRGRQLRVPQHPGRAAATRTDRSGPAYRRVDARIAGRVEQLPAVLRVRRRCAAAQRRQSRDDLPLRAVSRRWCDRRRRHRDARPAERARMGCVLRQGAAAAGAGRRPALRRQLEAQRGA